MRFFPIAFVALFSATTAARQSPPEVDAINATLDALHDAASKADGHRYFALFSPEARYIGTDASESWSLDQFREFAEPYFKRGSGWTYLPRRRTVVVSGIKCRCVAWFDELLDSESYGTSRGTGVLLRQNGQWKIAQYALTFPIPNDLAKGITAEIKAFEAKRKSQ